MYEIVKTSSGYASSPTALASFDADDGAEPSGALFVDAAGDLFGTTRLGGDDGNGVLFEIANTSSGYASTPSVLATFNVFDGALPGGLIADVSGDLVGTLFNGGESSYGDVFELATTTKPVPTTNDTTSVNVSTPGVAPTITGAVANQPLTAGSTDTPFSGVTITDGNSGAQDTLTITLTGSGALADGTGFSGLTSSAGGVYTLSGRLRRSRANSTRSSSRRRRGRRTLPRRRPSR